MANRFLTKVPKQSLSTNGAGRTKEPHAKEWCGTSNSLHIQKLTQNGSITFIERHKTMKFLEKKIQVKFYNLRFGNEFLDLKLKVWAKSNRTT